MYQLNLGTEGWPNRLGAQCSPLAEKQVQEVRQKQSSLWQRALAGRLCLVRMLLPNSTSDGHQWLMLDIKWQRNLVIHLNFHTRQEDNKFSDLFVFLPI